jgi:hypothetical protein
MQKEKGATQKGYGTMILSAILDYLWFQHSCTEVKVAWVPYNRKKTSFPDRTYKAIDFFIQRFGFQVSKTFDRGPGNELYLMRPADK